MKAISWKDSLEGAGILAIAASLIFVGYQIRQDREVAIGQSLYDWSSQHMEWAGILDGNYDVWIRGLRSDELSEVELAHFETLAGAYFAFQNARFSNRERVLTIGGDDVVLDVANAIQTFPGLKSVWEKMADRRPGGIIGGPYRFGVNQILAEFEQGTREHHAVNTYFLRPESKVLQSKSVNRIVIGHQHKRHLCIAPQVINKVQHIAQRYIVLQGTLSAFLIGHAIGHWIRKRNSQFDQVHPSPF